LRLFHFTNEVALVGVAGVAELWRCSRTGEMSNIVSPHSILAVGLLPRRDFGWSVVFGTPICACVWLTAAEDAVPEDSAIARTADLRLTVELPDTDPRLMPWRVVLSREMLKNIPAAPPVSVGRTAPPRDVYLYFGRVQPCQIVGIEPARHGPQLAPGPPNPA
jgi:hypothetical protein